MIELVCLQMLACLFHPFPPASSAAAAAPTPSNYYTNITAIRFFLTFYTSIYIVNLPFFTAYSRRVSVSSCLGTYCGKKALPLLVLLVHMVAVVVVA